MNFRFRTSILIIALSAVCLGTPVWAGMGTPGAKSGGIQVLNVVPADMSSDAAGNTPITIEFGGNITPALYQSITMNLFQGNRPIDGELFYNPSARQVMFKPKQPLPEGQVYTGQMSFADPSGTTSEKIWNFRVRGGSQPGSAHQTGAAYPAPAASAETPTVAKLSIIKANIASGKIQAGVPLEITFSEQLDLGSLKEAPVKLLAGREPVGIDYRLSRDLKTINLIPRTPLQGGVSYSVVVTQQIAGASGSKLAKNTLIPFRVGENSRATEAAATTDTEVPSHVLEECPPEPSEDFGKQSANPFGDRESTRAKSRETSMDAAFSPVPYNGIPARAPAQMNVEAPPKIVGLSPRNGDTISNLSQPVTVAFSSEIRTETLNEFTFRLEDDFGPVPSKIRYFPGRKQATLTPVGVLDSQKSYRVILTSGITGMTGQQIAAAMNTTFSTGAPAARRPDSAAFGNPSMDAMAMRPQPKRRPVPSAPMRNPFPDAEPSRDSRELEVIDDEAPPMGEPVSRMTDEGDMSANYPAPKRPAPAKRERLSTFKVTAIKPTANSDRVPRKSKIVVQLSEPAQQGTLNNVNVAVFGNQRRVDGRVSYDAQNRRAVFTPAEQFAAETQYKVVLSDKIKSSAGEPLIGRYSWQFTTEGEHKGRYAPPTSTDADSDFSLASEKKKTRQISATTRQPESRTGSSFSFVPQNSWVCKSIRKMAQKGLLSNYPFKNQAKISRYECAMSVNAALNNLKGMQSMAKKTGLKGKDLVELAGLAIEFKPELRSIGSDPSWLENYLENQGVKMSDIQARVGALNLG